MATPKRPLHRSPSSEPPRKRRHTDGIPSSPLSTRASSSRTSTPYPSRPFDSPSNPFGRIRTWDLIQDLPPRTSFAQHLVLRFQFVRRGAARETLQGIHRIVQVPQSYTLVHLRCLIRFLFGGAYGLGAPEPAHEGTETETDYMFELKKHLALYSKLFRPGQIKTGTTWAYSSGVQDPYLYFPDWEPEHEPVEDADALESPSPCEEEPVKDERKWMAEEDVTVAHVWPEGGDLSRGIIYQHDADLQVHITMNTAEFKSRRGRGNLPYVFRACGLVYLDEPSEEDNLEEEDNTAELDPSNWNDPEDAFADYYNKYTILPFSAYQHEAANSSSASLPDLSFTSPTTRRSSSPPLATPSSARRRLGSSSTSDLPASSPRAAALSSPARAWWQRPLGLSSPARWRFPKHTPAPRPKQRRRILHLQQRIGALTRARGDADVGRRRKRRAGGARGRARKAGDLVVTGDEEEEEGQVCGAEAPSPEL